MDPVTSPNERDLRHKNLYHWITLTTRNVDISLVIVAQARSVHCAAGLSKPPE
jgi:hypothetical protein